MNRDGLQINHKD